MSFIEGVTYGTLVGSANDMMGFTVRVGVDPPTPGEFNRVVEGMTSTPHRSRAIKLVVPPGGGSDLGVEAFCRKWKQGGYFLLATHDGQLSYRWEVYLDYLVIELTQSQWPVFRANEIVYPISLGPEPTLPHPLPKLVADRGNLDDKSVWKWLEDSKNPWHLLTERRRTLQRIVYNAEKA